MDKVKTLCSDNQTLYYFHEICQIPHGTDNEKGLSDYIYNWAKELGLESIQESCGNLIIKKSATPGFESSDPVLLQAHLDMVCAKVPDSTHDFLKDAITWKVEDDWISSACGTSLGADCGIGLALVMQILSDKKHQHPALEVLFTVREESDMFGAYSVNQDFFHSRRMINLDTSPDSKLLSGTCGGSAVEIDLPLDRIDGKTDMVDYELKITGLKGGHSGHDINKGYGNALLLMGRLIFELKKKVQFEIENLSGGSSRLTIPWESYASIRVSVTDTERFEQVYQELFDEYKQEYINLVPDIHAEHRIIKSKNSNPKVLTKESEKAFLSICLLIPNGIQEMSNSLHGTVESSGNLGVINMENSHVVFQTEVRSSYESTKRELIEKHKLLASLFGATIHTHSDYPAWTFMPNSPLRDEITTVYKDMYGKDMDVYTVHAGNEIGILMNRLGIVDAVAMGPTRIQFHTPYEKLSISSSINFEQFLWRILENLK